MVVVIRFSVLDGAPTMMGIISEYSIRGKTMDGHGLPIPGSKAIVLSVGPIAYGKSANSICHLMYN